MSIPQYLDWADNPDRTQFELVIVSWMEQCRDGNMVAVREVLDRLMGKVPQTNINANLDNPLTGMQDDELDQHIARLKAGIDRLS